MNRIRVKIIKYKCMKSTNSLPCFDDKIYIINKGCDGLSSGY